MTFRRHLFSNAARVVTRCVSFALIAAALPVEAASLSYQSVVLGNNPFAFYRQQETGISTGATADSIDASNRHATYQGTPSGGAAGGGSPVSDAAVAYSGAATGTASQYFGGANLRTFGSSLGTSSYEFIFKVNSSFPTQKQSLFGVFNTGSTTAAEITLNSQGNDALADAPNTTRLYIRGNDGDGVGVHFVNPTLYDGNFHHLVFTFDRGTLVAATSSGLSGGFAAYLDGVPQTLTFTSVNNSGTDADFGPDSFVDFGFDPTFMARNVRTTLGGTAVARQANVTLDEAVLYTRVLSLAEIAANFAAIPEPNSLALGSAVLLGLLLFRNREA